MDTLQWKNLKVKLLLEIFECKPAFCGFFYLTYEQFIAVIKKVGAK